MPRLLLQSFETPANSFVFWSAGWISAAGWAGINIDDFPNLKKWEERMWARPAVQKGANVPDPYRMKELLADKEAMEKHAAQVCIGKRARIEVTKSVD